ncbi:MAG: Ldh family oxidoreductase [Haloarculaceae archaeon]
MLTDPADDGGIGVDRFEAFSTRLLGASGAPEDIAARVAESLVLSDLRGHHSHGTRRIPSYVSDSLDRRDDGYGIDPTARPTVDSEGPTHALVDGQDGFGQLAGQRAVDLAVEKARENGVAMVGVRDATHLGRIGEWSERAAERGVMFAAFVYNHGRVVAPPGSAQRRYSTNPVSYGIPTFDALEFPIVLDVATSQVANGKTAEFAARGDPLPEAWTITEDGGSVTDARAFRDGAGALLPLGGLVSGYKGFGLAMVAELLGGIGSDAPVHGEAETNRGCAGTFLAVDPTLVTTRETIEERVLALGEYLAATEFDGAIPMGPVAYGDEALLPGEPEHLTERACHEHGIPLSDADVATLCDLAVEHGLEDAIPAAFGGAASASDRSDG